MGTFQGEGSEVLQKPCVADMAYQTRQDALESTILPQDVSEMDCRMRFEGCLESIGWLTFAAFPFLAAGSSRRICPVSSKIISVAFHPSFFGFFKGFSHLDFPIFSM
jgi:hypothetical protein